MMEHRSLSTAQGTGVRIDRCSFELLDIACEDASAGRRHRLEVGVGAISSEQAPEVRRWSRTAIHELDLAWKQGTHAAMRRSCCWLGLGSVGAACLCVLSVTTYTPIILITERCIDLLAFPIRIHVQHQDATAKELQIIKLSQCEDRRITLTCQLRRGQGLAACLIDRA